MDTVEESMKIIAARAAKVKEFDNLLQQISSFSDKKKQLYLEIYENALTDRQNAYGLFTTLSSIVADKSSEHAIHGATLSKYIERMAKANDQLLKLAEIISLARVGDDDDDEPMTPSEIFKKIKGS